MRSNATDAAECSTVETPAAPAGLLATIKSEPSSPERQRRRVLWRCIVCTDREAVFGRQGGAGFFPEWCQRCWRRKLRDLEGAKCDEDKNGPRLVAVTAEEHLSDAAIKVDHQLDPPGPEHQLRDPTRQSEYRGVSWSVRSGPNGRWRATIQHDGKRKVSYFDDEHEAARAVDKVARELRGDDAHGGRAKSGHCLRLNFPTEGEVKRAKERTDAERAAQAAAPAPAASAAEAAAAAAMTARARERLAAPKRGRGNIDKT